MLSFTGSLKVFLAAQAADLRKGFSGLYAMTAQVLREDPQSGALFVFTNRDRTHQVALLGQYGALGDDQTPGEGTVQLARGRRRKS
ncbi:MAG: IS66 family insertion sequence element accessory protein TnpB [Kiritimatiellia bacterium]